MPLASAASVAVRTESGQIRTVLHGRVEHGGRPLDPGDVFDLASLSKLFTATCALILVREGALGLDEPVAAHLPPGTPAGRAGVTLRELLTHRSGLPAESALWRDIADPGRLRAGVLSTPLRHPREWRHEYSCVGYILAGAVLESAAGQPLDTILRTRLTGPLGAHSVRFGPVPARGAVATETQPTRGALRGQIHDELAAALATPVGNAGLFGTARDVLRLAELLIEDGRGPRGERILDPASVRLLTEPGEWPGPGYGQAIGFRVNDAGLLGGARGVGHTGFTGTSLALDPRRGRAVALLVNRVHPTRETAGIIQLRRRVHEAVFREA